MDVEDEAEAEAGGAGAESWLRLSEALISGVHHALNNRMAALRGVGQVMEADLPANHPLAGALASELHRLEETAALLSLLGRREEELEPFQIESVLDEAARLFEMHHALRDRRLVSQVPEGLFPVLANPGGLLRGILLMLAYTAREGAGEIRLTAEGDERTVRITVSSSEANDPDMQDPELQSIPLSAIERAVEDAGGRVSRDGAGGGGMEATVLTLPEARKRQL